MITNNLTIMTLDSDFYAFSTKFKKSDNMLCEFSMLFLYLGSLSIYSAN